MERLNNRTVVYNAAVKCVNAIQILNKTPDKFDYGYNGEYPLPLINKEEYYSEYIAAQQEVGNSLNELYNLCNFEFIFYGANNLYIKCYYFEYDFDKNKYIENSFKLDTNRVYLEEK